MSLHFFFKKRTARTEARWFAMMQQAALFHQAQ